VGDADPCEPALVAGSILHQDRDGRVTLGYDKGDCPVSPAAPAFEGSMRV